MLLVQNLLDFDNIADSKTQSKYIVVLLLYLTQQMFIYVAVYGLVNETKKNKTINSKRENVGTLRNFILKI